MNPAAPVAVPTPVHTLPRSRRASERPITLVLLSGVGTFQLALAAGTPWGAASWGGQAPGVLPTSLRVASALTAVVYVGLGVTVATDRLGSTARRRILAAASLLMGLGAVMNLATPSPVEKLWAPVAGTLAVLL